MARVTRTFASCHKELRQAKIHLYRLVDLDKYQDSNALFLCFEHIHIKWYHLLSTPLEFERIGQSSSDACFDQHLDEKPKVEMKTNSQQAHSIRKNPDTRLITVLRQQYLFISPAVVRKYIAQISLRRFATKAD